MTGCRVRCVQNQIEFLLRRLGTIWINWTLVSFIENPVVLEREASEVGRVVMICLADAGEARDQSANRHKIGRWRQLKRRRKNGSTRSASDGDRLQQRHDERDGRRDDRNKRYVKNIQAMANEIFEISKQSFEHATHTMDKLRSGRGLDEVVAIQTNFVK